jgi:small-conductance mechanosensitive channel
MNKGKEKKRIGWYWLLGFAAFVVLLIVWRLIEVFKMPRLLEGVSEWFSTDFVRLWSQPYFRLGNVPVTPIFLIKSLIYIVLIILIARFTRRMVHSHLLIHTSLDIGQKFALERGIGYVVFVVGLIVGLQSMGLNLSTLMVMGGAVGLGIGLGLQTVANNFVAGIILLIERSIKVGDRVEVGELNGDVVQIGLRATWVRTNDNINVIVPNSEFTEKRVINWTAEDRQIRFSIPVGVSYRSNPEQVREILLKVSAENPDVLQYPKPDVIFVGFGDSSLNFELRVWTIRRVQTPNILKSELYFAIFRAFGEHGIEIPFPQRDLHLKSASAPITWRTQND